MKSRRLPFLLLTLVIVLPLLGLGWLGWRLGLEQDHVWQRELDQLLERHLGDIRRQALQPLDHIARQVSEVVSGYDGDDAALVARLRGLAFVEQVLLLGRGGDRRYPSVGALQDSEQAAFLQRTHSLWQGKALLHAGDSRVEGAPDAAQQRGWLSWHWQQDMELLYWQRAPQGAVVAVSVDSMGLLSDIIGVLPDASVGGNERLQLRDAAGRVLYQWGGGRATAGQQARLVEALPVPLQSWQLAMYFDDSRARSSGGRLRVLQLVVGLGTLALVLLGLGIWLYRELHRAGREATEQVNFVNQVSHELRTPLTNIRMYAELLEDAVADDADARRKLDVIITESRRLGRLIGNVLTFARRQKDTLRLHRVPASLDALLAETVEHFRPGLSARGIDVKLDCQAPGTLLLDPDAVTGIIGNLLSNAEKYAPGQPLEISTRQQAGELVLSIQDHGPGIARRHRRRVFQPFFRGGDRVTEGVSGTGIGLSIARDLARLHGGELLLRDSRDGALFELRLPIEEVKE